MENDGLGKKASRTKTPLTNEHQVTVYPTRKELWYTRQYWEYHVGHCSERCIYC